MIMSKSTENRELRLALGFIAILWIIYFVDLLLPIHLVAWGLVPRTISGLAGIATMPFLHGSLGHLIGNTIPLLVLLGLLIGSRANSVRSVIAIALLNGSLLWLIGRSSIHVGASGLIYGLIVFLISTGYFERRPVAIIVALITFFLYGSTVLFGVLPTAGYGVSWDGHLTGAIAGGIVAFAQSQSVARKQDLEKLTH